MKMLRFAVAVAGMGGVLGACGGRAQIPWRREFPIVRRTSLR